MHIQTYKMHIKLDTQGIRRILCPKFINVIDLPNFFLLLIIQNKKKKLVQKKK